MRLLVLEFSRTRQNPYSYLLFSPFSSQNPQQQSAGDLTFSQSFLHRVPFCQNQTNSQSSRMSLIPSFFGGRRSNVFDPFSQDLWDPFQDLPFTSTALSAPTRSDVSSETAQFANTRIDWRETPEAHVFKADLPGLKKEEVKVEVEEGRVLQISGERSREKEEKNETWHRTERSSGRFLRRFRLPENAKIDHIKASMENGVLTVTIPKEEIKKPDMKAIDISD